MTPSNPIKTDKTLKNPQSGRNKGTLIEQANKYTRDMALLGSAIVDEDSLLGQFMLKHNLLNVKPSL